MIVRGLDRNTFLVNSTLGVNAVSVMAVVPFTLNNIIQGRYVLGFLTLFVSVICTINVLFCYKGKYNYVLNLYCLVPSITLAIAFSLFELGVSASYWPLLGILCFYLVLPEKSALIVNEIFVIIILPIG